MVFWRKCKPHLFLIFLVIFAVICVLRTGKHDLDYKVYHRTAELAAQGDASFYDFARDKNWAYRYGPSFPILILPLAELSEPTARWIWGVINVLTLLVGWWLTEAVVRKRFGQESITTGVRWLTLLMVLDWVSRNAMQGNVNQVVYLCAIAGIWLNDRGRWLSAGTAVAIGATTKIFPGVIIGYFLLTRSYRAFWASVVACVLLLAVVPAAVLPFSSVPGLLQGWVSVLKSTGHYDFLMLANQAPYAVFHRFSGSAQLAWWASLAFALAAIGAFFWIGRRKSNEPLLALYAFCVPMFVLSNVFIEYALFMLPALMVCNHWFLAGRLDAAGKGLWWARIAIVALPVQAIIGREGALGAESLGFPMWGAAVLSILLLHGYRVSRRGTVAQQDQGEPLNPGSRVSARANPPAPQVAALPR